MFILRGGLVLWELASPTFVAQASMLEIQVRMDVVGSSLKCVGRLGSWKLRQALCYGL